MGEGGRFLPVMVDEEEVESEDEDAASVGQRQTSLLRLQPLHIGFSSLHFFLRRRQVKQPVLLRMMGMTRIMNGPVPCPASDPGRRGEHETVWWRW